jgi:hypothetical protein
MVCVTTLAVLVLDPDSYQVNTRNVCDVNLLQVLCAPARQELGPVFRVIEESFTIKLVDLYGFTVTVAWFTIDT